jgi:hypothetical protein
LLVIGFPVALILAWAFELTPEGIKRAEFADELSKKSARSRAWIYVVVIAGAISVALFFVGRYTAPNKQAEVRINGVVHVKSVLPEKATVPINWIAVGDPAVILAPNEHDKIWAIQKPLNFPMEAYGVERAPDGNVDMKEITRHLAESAAQHRSDKAL